MKQIEVKIDSHSVDITNSLRSFVEERSELILSRNKALTDLRIELRLDDEAGPESGVFALGFAVLPDQEVVASSVSKNPYSAIGSLIHKLEHELRELRRSKCFQRKPIGDIKLGAKIPKSRFPALGFSSDKRLSSSSSVTMDSELY